MRGKLPVLSDDEQGGKRLSIIYAGARNEANANFMTLFSLIKEFVYTNISRLEVCLCGPQLEETRSYSVGESSEVSVRLDARKIEQAFPSLQDLNAAGFHAIFLVAPGFSDDITCWAAAMQMMVSSNLPMTVTSYSSLHTRDNDALFDEDCLTVLWRARLVVACQTNPCHSLMGARGLGYKNRYVTIVQGPNPDAAVVRPEDYRRGMVAKYLVFQADFYRAQDSGFADRCVKIAAQLDAGEMPCPVAQRMSYFVNLAR